MVHTVGGGEFEPLSEWCNSSSIEAAHLHVICVLILLFMFKFNTTIYLVDIFMIIPLKLCHFITILKIPLVSYD